jgi:hypothetical protein
MRMGKTALLIAGALLVTTAAQAGWQDRVSPYDAKRLSLLDEARQKALSEAASAPDAGVIHAVLDRQAVSVSADALRGSWRCRTIKIGGMTPDVVYSWFHCRIHESGEGLVFEKISGSQRLSGELYPNESGGYVLLGAVSVKGEKAHIYSGNGASAGAMATPDDAAGILESTGAGSARIEFPYPVQESTFDVVELKR